MRYTVPSRLRCACGNARRGKDWSTTVLLDTERSTSTETADGPPPPELREALRDLDEATAEAREEGFPLPSDAALANARRLLPAMYELLPCRCEVYPTPDGEIAVEPSAGLGASVLVLCEPDGGALCLVNINGAHRRARYSDMERLPDGFVREALAELKRTDKPAI